MQIMRLIIAGNIDSKTAALLYVLQTASGNLQRTKFEPRMHDVILDPRSVADTLLGERIWEDEDFEEEEDDLDSEEGEDTTESKLARVTDNSVITPSGEEILKGFPFDVLRQAARELNQRT